MPNSNELILMAKELIKDANTSSGFCCEPFGELSVDSYSTMSFPINFSNYFKNITVYPNVFEGIY